GLERRLADRRLGLEVTPAARKLLADHGYDPDFGARPLKRVIQREIGDALALSLLEGHFSDGEIVRVDAADGSFVISTAPGAPTGIATEALAAG
ncbi:MAG: ATP-dependent chaperone ClpB, partial [Acidimicrobiaceae bacterium]|nr:ATP-dependent chaperone ClpB [Acidimicrobiaceae bacterium]